MSVGDFELQSLRVGRRSSHNYPYEHPRFGGSPCSRCSTGGHCARGHAHSLVPEREKTGAPCAFFHPHRDRSPPMSTPLGNTVVAHGRLTAQFYAPDNLPGDWQGYPVVFQTPFPSDDVRVVATASSDGVDGGLSTVPAVPIVVGANRNGFTIVARNSDCASGSAGMHWIAVLERRGVPSPTVVDVRTGVLHTRYYGADCMAGDWTGWEYAFSNPLPAAPTLVSTPTRSRDDQSYDALGGGALVGRTVLLQRIATPVAVTDGATATTIAVSARNGGGWPGWAGMNFLAVASGGAPVSGMIVDSGLTRTATLPPTGGSIYERIEVQFALPFSTPPVVLLCACDRGLLPGEGAAAIVGIAEGITTHGFSVEAMNTDSVTGTCAFYWIAVGCGTHCGAGSGIATVVTPPPVGVGPIGTTAGPVAAPPKTAST